MGLQSFKASLSFEKYKEQRRVTREKLWKMRKKICEGELRVFFDVFKKSLQGN